jgi:hypothetical protein
MKAPVYNSWFVRLVFMFSRIWSVDSYCKDEYVAEEINRYQKLKFFGGDVEGGNGLGGGAAEE